MRLLHQWCTGQAHTKDLLSTKSVDLDFNRPSLCSGLPQSLTDVQCLHLDHLRSRFCSSPLYCEARILDWSLDLERNQSAHNMNFKVIVLSFGILIQASSHDGSTSLVHVYIRIAAISKVTRNPLATQKVASSLGNREANTEQKSQPSR